MQVFPSQTVYIFEEAGVRLTLTVSKSIRSFSTFVFQFSTPSIVLPITFLTYTIECTDNQAHNIKLYYDNTAEVTRNSILIVS